MITLNPIYRPADNPGTVENPYDYDSLISYLSLLEKTTPYNYTVLPNVMAYKDTPHKLSRVQVVYRGNTYRIRGLETLPGGESKLLKLFSRQPASLDNYKKEVDVETDFELVYIKARKTISDFETVPEYIGKHRYCESGGWYSHRPMYNLKDKIFINV